MIVLHAKKGEHPKVMDKLKQLLKIAHKVTQNESRDTLSYVLDQVPHNHILPL
jgi:hypothetical protein